MSFPDEDVPKTVSEPCYSAALYQNLHQRADTLLQELNAFEAHVKSHRKEKEVEIRVFKRGIESELKGLQNIATFFELEEQSDSTTHQRSDIESPHLHVLKSSNLPFYESIWNVVKSCSRVTAVSKRFYSKQRDESGPSKDRGQPNIMGSLDDSKRQNQKGVLVDVVANNGLEWIKVSTISERKLLFDIAKEGWESYTAEISDDDSNGSQIDSADRSPRQLELVRLAHELQSASNSVRVQFQHPRVRFVLPKLQEGQIGDVDAFVADLRATGAIVQCSSALPSGELRQDDPSPIQPAILDRLLPGYDQVHGTGIVNLDCTILLAVVSDISHMSRDHLASDSHALSGTYHSAIMRQIEFEESRSMVWNDIYPILADQELHCTSKAAQRMREIVQCMGTLSERGRADIILGEGRYADRSAQDLRQLLAGQSIHTVPLDLQLPIKVIEFESDNLLSSPAPKNGDSKSFPHLVAAQSMKLIRLTPINSSVFLYGWKEQILTFTSNRAVATALLRAIDEVLDRDENEENFNDNEHEKFYGPQIHICETARSLIGKSRNKPPI
jgi:hypothetical protein